MQHYDAIIIGGGPAGASAAILLAGAGWQVALIEQSRFPRRKVCGECIAPSNWPLFAAMGVAEQIDAVAGPDIRQLGIISGRHSVRSPLPGAGTRGHGHGQAWGRAVMREHLDTILLERAKQLGATVYQPWMAESVEVERRENGTATEAHRHACTTRNLVTQARQTFTAPVLICAQGSWTPHGLDGAAQGHAPAPRKRGADLLAFKRHFEHATLPSGQLHVISFKGGYGGMVSTAEGKTTLAFCMRRDTLAACRAARPGQTAAEAAAAYVFDACPAVAASFATATGCGAWLGAGPLRTGIRVSAHDRAFLIGNAAGEAHPIIGEGMSMAIQSAWLLAGRLVGNTRGLESLPYEQGERGRAGEGMQRPPISGEALNLNSADLCPRSGSWSASTESRLHRLYARDWHRAFSHRLTLAATLAHMAMRPALAGVFVSLCATYPALLDKAAMASGKLRQVIKPVTQG